MCIYLLKLVLNNPLMLSITYLLIFLVKATTDKEQLPIVLITSEISMISRRPLVFENDAEELHYTATINLCMLLLSTSSRTYRMIQMHLIRYRDHQSFKTFLCVYQTS